MFKPPTPHDRHCDPESGRVGNGCRFAKRKMSGALGLLFGADTEVYEYMASRRLPSSEWRQAFLLAGEEQGKIRQQHPVEEQDCRMKAVIAELAMEKGLGNAFRLLRSAEPWVGGMENGEKPC